MSKPLSFITNRSEDKNPFAIFLKSLDSVPARNYAIGMYNSNKGQFSDLELIEIVKESLGVSVENLASVLK